MPAKKRMTTPSPASGRPTPSPQMGRLMMAPPAPKSARSDSSRPSPGFDLLGEALMLNRESSAQNVGAPRRAAGGAGPSAAAAPTPAAGSSGRTGGRQQRLPGVVVDALPSDWTLKRGCLVTSASSLEWCAHPPPSVPAAALRARGAAGGAEPAADALAQPPAAEALALPLALERSLLQWRHPAQRLPPALLKQLGASSAGSAEGAYLAALNDHWDSALRSLFFSLRDGRCPYFYCRSEEDERRTQAPFSILWRNGAVGNDAGAELPLGVSASDGSLCYAVLAPSHRGLRAQLEKHHVPFETPLAPRAAAGAPPASADAADDDEPQLPDDAAADVALSSLNRGQAKAQLQPESAAGKRDTLATVDGQMGSTLLFQGREALHALYEFLINTPANQYFLTLQLLAPLPFAHGSPYSPRLTYQSGLRASEREGGTRPDALRLEDADSDRGAVLLPGTVRKLCDVLKRSQPAGFELALQPDATKAAEALNVRTARPPPGARDIGVLVAPRPQPEARLWAPGGEPDDWPPVLTAPGQGEGATPRRPDERERERERSLSSVRFGSDGVMRVVQ